MKNRFKLGEKTISKNAEYSYLYANNILKNRFKLGEKTIDTKQDAVNKRAEERKELWKARHDAEMEYANLNDPRYDPAVMGDEVMRDDMLKEQAEAAQKKDQEK